MIMGPYEVELTGDTIDGLNRTYFVDYRRRDAAGNIVEQFQLTPNVLYDKSLEKIAASNPSTKRYMDRDIFTHIAALPPEEMDINAKREKEAGLNYRELRLGIGRTTTIYDTVRIQNPDTFKIRSIELTLEEVDRQARHPEYQPETGDITVGLRLSVKRSDHDSTYQITPLIVLREQLLYNYPAQLNALDMRFKLEESIFDAIANWENELDYTTFEMAENETVDFNGLRVQFLGYDKNPSHEMYLAQEGDIAVGAVLQVSDPTGGSQRIEPVFLIRDSRPLNVKDEAAELGLHARFVSLDPQTGRATIMLSRLAEDAKQVVIPFKVATNAYRSDWIALQAIEFPGINLFWAGSLMMMIGLAFSMVTRLAGQPRRYD